MSARRIRDRGFALLIVLFTLALVALLVTRVLADGRTELKLAGNLRASLATQAVVDGAVYEATFRLMADQWRPDGVPHLLRIGSGLAEARVVDLAGRINPNNVSQAVMQQMLIEVGAPASQAAAIAAAMEDWRTPGVPGGRPFRSLDEIGLVRGMTPALLAALAPHLSVFQEGETDRLLADPLVAQALAADGEPPADEAESNDQQRPLVVEITASTVPPTGARFTRRAVVRIGMVTGRHVNPWTILAWE